MRSVLLFSLVFTSLLAGPLTAAAQRPALAAAAQPATNRLALAAATPQLTASAPMPAARLACSKLNGQVLGPDGQPLIGATVSVKGTQHLFITDGDGRYQIEVPVYQGQTLEIEAAGYTTREVVLTDCTAPAVSLEPAAGTRVKKHGKRTGQIVRFGTADMQ